MLYHLHVIMKFSVANPRALTLNKLNSWTKKLIEDQNMHIVIGPNAYYVLDAGNEGPTGGCNIKTSHFAYHIWDNKGLIQADLYTCGPLDVLKLVKAFEVFEPVFGEVLVINRENELDVLLHAPKQQFNVLLDEIEQFEQIFAATLGR